MTNALLAGLGSLVLVAAVGCIGCDKTTKVGPDPPTATATEKGPSMPPTATPTASTTSTTPTPVPPEVKKLAKSSSAFAFDLYGKVKGATGNLAMSPASISAAGR